jgi:dienelactone hydrolase
MTASIAKTYDIPVEGGRFVRADQYIPLGGAVRGVIILCHGFKAHRQWGFIPELANRLRQAGFLALPIDFSHNGCIPDGPNRTKDASPYANPDLFRKNTIQKEFEDLSAAVRHVYRSRLENHFPPHTPIGLFGHSRGGFVSILYALEKKDVHAICSWSATSDPDFYTDRQKKIWRDTGSFAFPPSEGQTALSVGTDYLDDLEANADRYRLVERVSQLRTPHLLVHGAMDMVIPAECSKAIYQAETKLKHKRLVTIQTGHTFGCTENCFSPNPAFERASEETIQWFQDYLSIGV